MNELIMFLMALFFLSSALFAYRLGRIWLQAFLGLAYVLTICVTPKFVDFFGLSASAGAITYAGIFLATDMLTERYGKKAGFQAVRISLLMAFVFVVMTQGTLWLTPLPFMEPLDGAMNTVFGTSLRVFIAGLTVYFVAQNFDVWFYHRIHSWTGEKWLWLRNNGSTFVSQTLDTILFFSLAFYGSMPNEQFFKILLAGLVIKLGVALLDTPFMYLARRITPKDLVQAP